MRMITVWQKLPRIWCESPGSYMITSKRTEKILEAYEMKLHMYSDYIVRSQIFDDIMEKYPDDSYLQEQIALLSMNIDNRD